MHFSSVDFPEPLCPSSPIVSPSEISKWTSFSAHRSS